MTGWRLVLHGIVAALIGTAVLVDGSHPVTATIRPLGTGSVPRQLTADLEGRLDQPLRGYSAGQLAAQSAAGATIPIWSSTVTAGQDANTYSYQMVGVDPHVKQSSPSTTVVTPIIPVILKIAGDTFDPTTASCGESSSVLASTGASPIFNNTAFAPGGTDVGDTQYADAFQRANFWSFTNPHGINPGYHVLLSPKLESPITVTIPTAHGRIGSGVGCSAQGVLDGIWAQSVLQKTYFPKVETKKYGVNPTTFPIFLIHNVVIAQGLHGPCCLFGAHSSFANKKFGGAAQTWAFVDYDDSGTQAPLTAPDSASISHEVGEWMDDPFVTNLTPLWGHTGQVFGCQANLEVGDPLTGTNFTVDLNGSTWHLQDLAFLSWFYGQAPSTAVNGQYSFNNGLKSAPPLC